MVVRLANFDLLGCLGRDTEQKITTKPVGEGLAPPVSDGYMSWTNRRLLWEIYLYRYEICSFVSGGASPSPTDYREFVSSRTDITPPDKSQFIGIKDAKNQTFSVTWPLKKAPCGALLARGQDWSWVMWGRGYCVVPLWGHINRSSRKGSKERWWWSRCSCCCRKDCRSSYSYLYPPYKMLGGSVSLSHYHIMSETAKCEGRCRNISGEDWCCRAFLS